LEALEYLLFHLQAARLEVEKFTGETYSPTHTKTEV
jgi:hypothetical protein